MDKRRQEDARNGIWKCQNVSERECAKIHTNACHQKPGIWKIANLLHPAQCLVDYMQKPYLVLQIQS